MEFQLIKKTICLVKDQIKVNNIYFHENLLIIISNTFILIFKGQKKLFKLKYAEPYSKQNLICIDDNFIYYKYQNQMLLQKEQSIIRKKNLSNRFQSTTFETKYYKLKNILILKKWIFILTHNQVIREQQLEKQQKQQALKSPIDFIAYSTQIIILQQKELNFFNIDLQKLNTILLAECAQEIQINLNQILLSGNNYLYIINLLNNRQMEQISVNTQGCEYTYRIGQDILFRIQQCFIRNELYHEIVIYQVEKGKFKQLFNTKLEGMLKDNKSQ
ncbi:hypothetical protein pb186bvf_006229 [Paramecium bursaria]